MTGRRVVVVADETDRDGGHVAERLRQLGFVLDPVDRDEPPSAAGDAALVLLLGSERSAHDVAQASSVAAEAGLVRSALASGIPAMGICYGAQVMARALGGTSWRADEVEVGWQRIDTTDPVLCPEGPWAQMHHDVFAPGSASRVLGTTWRGPQCFVDEAHGARAIAWQFHPEVTPETYERWLREGYHGDRSNVDVTKLIDETRARATSSRRGAHALTDAALRYLRVDVEAAAFSRD